MSSLRKVLFAVFTIIYLVVAPLTVFYALGYIFNPGEPAFVPTGLVYLNSEPAGVTVSLDGKLLKDQTPVILRNLKPGFHEVRLELPGKHPWQRRIQVKAEQALQFENVLLFPTFLPPQILSDFPVSRIWHVPEGEYLLLLHEEKRASGLYLFDLRRKEMQRVFPALDDPKTLVQSVHLHPAGDRALILLEKDGLAQSYFVEFTVPLKTRDLTDFFNKPAFEDLQWSKENRNVFFYLEDETLKRFNAEHGVLHPVVAKQVLGYTSHEGRLFILDEAHLFLETSEKGKIRELLFEGGVKARRIFGESVKHPYSIFFLPHPFPFSLLENAVVIFLSQTGRLISNRLPYVLDEDVKEVALADSHARMAYRKDNELWVVDFDEPRKPSFFERGPEPRRIYQGGRPEGPLFWFYKDQYLLFLEDNEVWVQDFEGGQEALRLFEISGKARDLALDRAEGFLYFADSATRRLSRTKILRNP